MKLNVYFILVSIILSIIGCSRKPDYNNVKVGMTYNEVEESIGKPASIERGFNKYEDTSYNNEEDNEDRYFLDTEGLLEDTLRWLMPKTIINSGSALYVSWIYDVAKADTYYVQYYKLQLDNNESYKKQIKRTYYQVLEKYTVLFDVASGRVVTAKYLPFNIEKVGDGFRL